MQRRVDVSEQRSDVRIGSNLKDCSSSCRCVEVNAGRERNAVDVAFVEEHPGVIIHFREGGILVRADCIRDRSICCLDYCEQCLAGSYFLRHSHRVQWNSNYDLWEILHGTFDNAEHRLRSNPTDTSCCLTT